MELLNGKACAWHVWLPQHSKQKNWRVSSHAVFQSTYHELPGNHLAVKCDWSLLLQADTGRSPVKTPAYTTEGDLAQRHLSLKIILRIPIKPLNWQEYMCIYTQREVYFTVFNRKTNYFNVEYLQKYYTTELRLQYRKIHKRSFILNITVT